MSSLPRKSVTGLPLKKYVLDTLNGLIDYLQTHRIKAGKGIDVRETASGYVIGLAQPPSNPPQVLNAGGGADGIEASVTGGTASVTLTGGTGSVNLVGTGGCTISENLGTGDIEINATGGTSTISIGFPDFTQGVAVSGRTTYGPFNYPVWLVGNVRNYTGSGAVGDCQCLITLNGNGFSCIWLWLMYTSELKCQGTYGDYVPSLENHVFMPIPPGVYFYINHNHVASDPATLDLYYYPCI